MQHVPRSAFLGSLALAALAPRVAGAQALTIIRATSAIDDPATPYLYAMESGLFRKNGIDASLERSTSGAAAASAVVGGSFEVGKASVISFLSAHVRGLPLVAVAAAGDYDAAKPTAALAVRPDGPVHSGADLNGKIVAVSAINDLFSLAARAWIDAHGGDSSTVKFIELPQSSTAASIAAGRIDAAVMVHPFLARGLEAGTIRVVGDPVSALGNHHTDSMWFTTIAFAQKNPAVIDRFTRTIHDAAVYVNGHPAETAPLLTKFAKMDSTDAMTHRTLQGTRLDAANLQPMIDAAARYKTIPERFDAKDLIYVSTLH
jgi:NitT/TauT family transport system substrate-binding protein